MAKGRLSQITHILLHLFHLFHKWQKGTMNACSFPGVTFYLRDLMRSNIGRGRQSTSGLVRFFCSLSVTFHVITGLHILQLCRVFVPKQRGAWCVWTARGAEEAGGRRVYWACICHFFLNLFLLFCCPSALPPRPLSRCCPHLSVVDSPPGFPLFFQVFNMLMLYTVGNG